jgi:hypothetical protein
MLVSVRQTSDGATNEYTANYTYDVLNRRVLEVDWQTGLGSSTTRMGYDKSNTLWADLTTSNTLTMRYVTGANAQQLIARADGSGNVNWYLQDKQGSVRPGSAAGWRSGGMSLRKGCKTRRLCVKSSPPNLADCGSPWRCGLHAASKPYASRSA